MYKSHRYEFNRHIKRKLTQFIATIISLLFVIGFEVALFYSSICQQSFLKSNTTNEKAFYSPTSLSYQGGGGFCTYFMEYFVKFFDEENNVGMIFWLVDFAIFIPIITFFIFDNPHDCFVCLGKDPDRRYSIHQLKVEEKVKRMIQAKYGISNVVLDE